MMNHLQTFFNWYSYSTSTCCAVVRPYPTVKINAADVMLIVQEIEVDKKAAEMRLRENGGDVVAALRSYV